MALPPGARLGVYEITAPIGEGGMGQVFRARDTRLDRDVAIKVLPEAFAHDAERLARFTREAKTLASLNHPHIAAIYGLEESRGLTALVMELVEGEDLSQRIARGAIPIDEALPIARQIAEALEAAHEQGIVHRDLKPANIKVRPDGAVKVLDFGLAKATGPAEAGHYVQGGAQRSGPDGRSVRLQPDFSQAPTITTPAHLRQGYGGQAMTGVGMILGTAAYMAPEQARGKAVDKRADVWAFGAVIYEMLTGQRAFAGMEVSDVLASVLAREPDWTLLPRGLSPTLTSFIKRCLHKDPKQRVPDIATMRLALDGVFDAAPSLNAGVVQTAQPIWRRLAPFAAGAVVATVAAGFAAWTIWPADRPRTTTRFVHTAPQTVVRAAASQYPLVAVSPDGRQFLYSSSDGFQLRRMGELDPRPIPRTGGQALTYNPMFSPDGESIAYLTGTEIHRIATSGGPDVVVAKIVDRPGAVALGGSWASDNTILYSQLSGVWRVSADGGTPELVVPAKDGEIMSAPHLLPDSEWLLFSVTKVNGATRWDQAEIVAQSLRTSERKVLSRGGDPQFVQPGHLVYAVGNDLFALAFDADRVTVTGRPVPVIQGVQRSLVPANDGGTANYGVSGDGTLVYLSAGSAQPGLIANQRTLVWVNRTGREEPLSAPPRAYSYPRISPDGTQIVVDVRDAESDIWVWSLQRSTLTRLTFDPRFDRFPIWSPDGRRIVFSSQRDGSRGNVFWQMANGAGEAELLARGANDSQVFPTSFSPDGTRLLVHGDPNGTQVDDIGVVSLGAGAGAGVIPLLHSTFAEANATVSPDGRWLAYESNESGKLDVYVRPFPNVDSGRWQVSTGGGTQAVWARNGRELLYRSGDAMMSVPIETGASFVARTPVVVFRGQYAPSLGGRNYDVSPDGQRFLMLKVNADAGGQSAPSSRITVVENWTEELKRLVPVN